MNSATNMRTASRSRPELSRDDLLRLKWLLGALIALTSLSAVWFFELPGGLILFPAVALVAGAGVRPDLVLRAPAWVWKLGFPALLTGVVADYALNGSILEAFLRLNVMLITLRAVSPRAKRDDLQLLVLCLFLAVMAGVLTVSLGFAVLILVFTALGLGFLLLITLCDRAVGGQPPVAHGTGEAIEENWTRAPWGGVLSRALALADWRFIGMAAGLFFSAILITSLLFLAIPRFEIGSSLGFMGLRNKRSLSGFTDSVSFGDVTDIKQDNSTALRVETSDPDAVPANPYWRMVVLDAYENGRFRVSPGARHGDKPTERGVFSVPGSLPFDDASTQWTFYLEPGISRYLPLGGQFSVIRLREGAQLFHNKPANVVALGLEPQKMFAYRVDGMEFGGRIADPDLGRLQAQAPPPGRKSEFIGYPATLLHLALSEEDLAKLGRVVSEITGGREVSAAEFSQLALAHLASRHAYSLSSALPPGRGDPVVKWIESTSPGHCEYFAGAFTLLARSAGHRARVVTGFAGGTWNDFEGYFMIRNSDAHAWVEIHDGTDWVRVDPTPGAAGAGATEESTAGTFRMRDRSWRAYMDSLRVLWYRRIVNFDERQQSEVADAVKTMTRESGARLLSVAVILMERIEAWLRRPWEWQRIVRTALIVIAAAILVIGAWRTRRRWWAKLSITREADPIRARAGVWLGRLRNSGALGSEPDVTAELQRLRFGPVRLTSYPVELFKRARRLVREAGSQKRGKS
ncbi:MAG TPA: DUF3488 and transglutaminase-like domain-containing protein [Opitutaceae bacterium]|nr:DUF3488 and transglutaminase-like domain-containing protein [Opitutaceae bacterium]